MERKKVTIRDIAKKSGFSRGTVSRALSDPPVLIKEETKNKILAVARKCGYVKDISAQTLGRGKSRDIGLFVPDMFVSPFYNDFYIKLISSVLRIARSFGYDLRLILVGNKERFAEIMKKVKSFKLNGLILAPDWWEELYKDKESLKNSDIPIVLLNDPFRSGNIYSVVLDDFKGGYEGTKFLIDSGHKRIAIYRGFPKDMEERYEGYKQAMADSGLKINKNYVIRGVPDESIAGYENTEKLLKNKEWPTAIFCLGDDMAVATMGALKKFGVKCPEKISVLGYDGMEIGNFTDPRLTTMSRPVTEMGARAVRVLLNKEGAGRIRHQKVKAELVIRDSCRKV